MPLWLVQTQDVLRRGLVGMRGFRVIRLRRCTNGAQPPLAQPMSRLDMFTPSTEKLTDS